MPVNTLMPGVKPFAPISDINARMPPSPRLSARITIRQYLIETVMINVQNISDSTPSALCGVKCPPVACTTVCSVYKRTGAKIAEYDAERAKCRPLRRPRRASRFAV